MSDDSAPSLPGNAPGGTPANNNGNAGSRAAAAANNGGLISGAPLFATGANAVQPPNEPGFEHDPPLDMTPAQMAALGMVDGGNSSRRKIKKRGRKSRRNKSRYNKPKRNKSKRNKSKKKY